MFVGFSVPALRIVTACPVNVFLLGIFLSSDDCSCAALTLHEVTDQCLARFDKTNQIWPGLIRLNTFGQA